MLYFSTNKSLLQLLIAHFMMILVEMSRNKTNQFKYIICKWKLASNELDDCQKELFICDKSKFIKFYEKIYKKQLPRKWSIVVIKYKRFVLWDLLWLTLRSYWQNSSFKKPLGQHICRNLSAIKFADKSPPFKTLMINIDLQQQYRP